ncbi:MAG: acyltransferase [Terracidiphilus sp.]
MLPASNQRTGRIHPLTSLRFFAALFVMFYHTLPTALPGYPPGRVGAQWLSIWPVSVSFFFFLSGYILAVVYLRPGKPVNRRSFWAARFARIYPLFFATLVLDTPNVVLLRSASLGLRHAILKTAGTFLFDMSMLQAWTPHLLIICTPNWSLSVEAMFYALFPLLAPALWRLEGKKLWLAAFLIYSAGLVFVGTVALHLDKLLSGYFPLFHLSTFLLGVLLARWQQAQQERPRPAPARPWQVYGVLLAALAAYFLVVVNVGIHIPFVFVHDGLLAPVFACTIWAFSCSDTLIARAFSVSWLVVLGEASYGLYLIHVPVWWYFVRALPAQGIHIWYPCYLSTCIGLSVLSFYFLETPARKWVLRRMAVRPRETMEAASAAQ